MIREKPPLSRRQTLLRMIAGGAALGLAGCDRISRSVTGMSVIDSAESLTRTIQRALLAPREALAPDYIAARDEKFINWKLDVGGLVDTSYKISLAELRQMPSRTQITRHDCVEG